MSQAPQFVISEFTNPSGEIVFRLTGWLDGKRIRKNFKTREEVVLAAKVRYGRPSEMGPITSSAAEYPRGPCQGPSSRHPR